MIADSLDEEDIKVGPGVIVEIDESKLGKRKYNRGHKVDGVWLVGGIERTPCGGTKRVIFVRVEDRSAETLEAIIQKYVLPGSILYTDLRRGYYNISRRLGFVHGTVNHKETCVSPEGVHTNTIEGTWCGLKLLVPKRNRTRHIDEFLSEYIWRKRVHGRPGRQL